MSVKIKWFPRSWLQIKYNKKIIYIDPSYLKTYFVRHPTNIDNGDDGLPEELPKGDIILYTHSHKDHCKLSTLNQLRTDRTVIFAPKSCSKELTFEYTIVKPNEKYSSNRINIETVNAYNTVESNSIKKVHKKGTGVGYILTLGNLRIYHSGDTDFIPDMIDLKNIDIAFLPVGGTFTMDISEAIVAAKAIKPKVIIPIHHLNADPTPLYSYFGNNTLNIEVKIPSIGEELIYTQC